MSESDKIEVVEKKEKKEKKVMTPERLEQLAKARLCALEIRRAGAAIKEEQKEMADAALEEKLERERQLNEAVKKSLIKNEINNTKLLPVPIYTNTIVPCLKGSTKHTSVNPPITERVWDASHEEEEEEQPIIVKKKTKKPIKTKIVIEQSSDDEDEFHNNEHVIFVKRKSKNDSINKHTSVNKVVPATTPVPPNSPEQPLANVAPNERAFRPQPEFTNFVNMMANNGGFINRRKYY
jgi:hypothetical protein